MKKLFIKPFDKILIILLGFIGFLTGCSLINPPVVEYGVPHADYEVKGIITDSITSVPIQHIQVIITQNRVYYDQDLTLVHVDTLARKETDSAGKYDIQFQSFPLEENTFQIKAEDIDGLANGGDFSPQQKEILFKQSDLTGNKDGWYVGKALKILDFKLKKK